MRTMSRSGLYDPRYEHDACGVGFVVNVNGAATHAIVRQGIQVLENLVHRGACGCDPETGDGAGMLLQLPHRFFAEEAERLRFDLPAPGAYAVGMVFLPGKAQDAKTCMRIIEQTVREEGQTFLGWREVPRDSSAIGWLARRNEPVIRQVFVRREQGLDTDGFERTLLVIRRVVENRVRESAMAAKDQFYIVSLSARTIVYKGLMLAQQMDRYYPDLSRETFESGLALVHQRYSTNTLPTWPLAHPFRFLAHNGEINTLRGNINMMASRERHFATTLFGENISKLLPILTEGASDSAIFDNAFELLVRAGRSPAYAMMMMIPEPWSGHESMPDDKRAFYEYHACMMEPWDGPASIAFTDGVRIGAVLDRNGLRPSRYWVTNDGFVVMASEVGVLDIPQEKIIRKGRLEPGRMFLIDTEEQRIISDEEIKEAAANLRPYRRWLKQHRVTLPPDTDCPPIERVHEKASLFARQQVFGYTQEDLDILMTPMAQTGAEAVGSMGNDSPLAVLSKRPYLLFNYFKQLFAQVTNPPIDPIREEIVMSMETTLGRERNLLDETPKHCEQLHLFSPILSDVQLAFLKGIDKPGLKASTISTLFRAADGPEGLGRALDRICADASAALAAGATILVLSDRGADTDWAPIPSLLATGAVHHHLVRGLTRAQCGLVIESGEPREVMHFALLAGYGAGAINPYLAFETIYDMILKGVLNVESPAKAIANYIKAIEKGLLKVMSKIGISTLQSYRSAQIFEAVGLGPELIARCFTGTPSRVGGIGVGEVAQETLMRHTMAFSQQYRFRAGLDPGGQYRWRQRGEFHQYERGQRSFDHGYDGRQRQGGRDLPAGDHKSDADRL